MGSQSSASKHDYYRQRWLTSNSKSRRYWRDDGAADRQSLFLLQRKTQRARQKERRPTLYALYDSTPKIARIWPK